MKTVKLKYTIPKHQDMISYTSGIRPYRSEGIRLEKQIIQGKQIYHDYGHGGGGLSLGWGCAKYVIQELFLTSHVDNSKPIAILGAGIIGLSTALQLVDKGFTVNLYADNFAYDTKKGKSQITTTVAAGLWMPVKISSKSSLKDLSLNTLSHLYEVIKIQKQTNSKFGISQMECYIVNDKQAELYSTIKGIIPYQQIKVTFDGVQTIDSIVFKTLVIESSFYIPYLLDKLNKSGLFKIIQKHFDTPQEIAQLREQTIFNCLGFSGNKLFKDPSPMKPVKGHVAKLKAVPQVMNFILFLKTGDRFILQVPHQQKGVFNLGISFQQNNYDPLPQKKQIDTILQTANKYFTNIENKRIPMAKL